MVEGGDLLDGDFATAGFVDGGTYDTVSAFADDVENLILGALGLSECDQRQTGIWLLTDVEADLARSWLSGGCSMTVLCLCRCGGLFWHGGGGGRQGR